MKISILVSLLIFLMTYFSKCSNGCLKCNLETKKCLFCDITSNYILEDGKCILLQYENCILYDINGECIRCKEKFYLNERNCVSVSEAKLIDKCLFYRNEDFCEQCEEKYFFNDGKCE